MSRSFTDTHCHISDPEFFPNGGDAVYEDALAAGVGRMILVGTDPASSEAALAFAERHEHAYASFGIHPHDASKHLEHITNFLIWCSEHRTEKVVAIGEVGLDYHYMNSPREKQRALFEQQIDVALRLELPLIFHVREAFDDFWPLLDNFRGVRGVLHSYTDNLKNLEQGLSRGLYVGVNGIATFARDRDEVTKAIPLEKMVLETDAPFLTPAPLRGKINVPGNVPIIASYVAELRDITVEELSQTTEAAASRLFF